MCNQSCWCGLMGYLTMLKTCSHFQPHIQRRTMKATQKRVSGLFIWGWVHQMIAPTSVVYQWTPTYPIKLQMTVHLRTKLVLFSFKEVPTKRDLPPDALFVIIRRECGRDIPRWSKRRQIVCTCACRHHRPASECWQIDVEITQCMHYRSEWGKHKREILVSCLR